MTGLVLGPILRYVGTDVATVWVEADAPCEVEVLGHRERTFTVEGRHYALLCIDGLAPREAHPYDVRLDGRRVWPLPDDPFPQPAIRTLDSRGPFRVAFGSCRVALPHRPPYTLAKDEYPEGREFDALYTLARELLGRPPEGWPDLLLMLGDQVYVDEGSPAVRRRIRATRDTSAPPGQEVASFEEYTWLYHESWGDPVIRWLLSTIPTAMVLDDHDMADDWNISRSWKEEMNRRHWWRERLVGGPMSYWIYQHIGNLAPEELERHEEYDAVRRASDGGGALREFVEWVDSNGEGKVWSFKRDHGRTRLVVVDGEEESVERAATDQPQSVFDRFAEASSHFVSTGAFFGISVVLVLLWFPTIFLIPSVDTWQLVLNTAVSVLAFVLVALLQNSERRSDLAAHRKLDAIAAGLADLMQHGVDPAASDLQARAGDLRRAVGLEDRM
jgi:Low affinity iron permease/PhoD-like phosphatase